MITNIQKIIEKKRKKEKKYNKKGTEIQHLLFKIITIFTSTSLYKTSQKYSLKFRRWIYRLLFRQ